MAPPRPSYGIQEIYRPVNGQVQVEYILHPSLAIPILSNSLVVSLLFMVLMAIPLTLGRPNRRQSAGLVTLLFSRNFCLVRES